MPVVTVQQTPYLPLVGRSGVAPSRSSSDAIARQVRATLGWGACSHPTRRAQKERAPLPIKGRDGVCGMVS